jgi:hypothetical protein
MSDVVVEYASPRSRPLSRGDAALVAGIACVVAVGILWGSATQAGRLIEWGPCGTGRHEAGQVFHYVMPALCAIPGGCWWYARGVAAAAILCRLSTVASATGWAVCASFV